MTLLLDVPALPHDLLRLIFEHAAHNDTKTALKLVLVSQLAQKWIELVLYANVSLRRQTSTRAFLRTIETSPNKPPVFFATNVKSLCISHDGYNDRTVKIIAACRGILSLTLWVIPVPRHLPGNPAIHHNHNPHFYAEQEYNFYSPQTQLHLLIDHHSRHVPPGPRLYFPQASSSAMASTADLTRALSYLRPRRLSILLSDILGPANNPNFHLPFFNNVTHFGVVNKWEDWTSWSGFESIPCLTHLSIDLSMGDIRGIQLPFVLGHQADENALRAMRTGRIAKALGEILACCARIRVVVVLLLFDPNPLKTTYEITRAIMGTRRRGGFRREYDPRLVFAQDTQPFRDREAHSMRERETWRRAEETVKQQRAMSAPIVLDL